MNRPYKSYRRNRNNRLLIVFLLQVLLISLSSFGYAQYSNTVTAVATLENAVEDMHITAYEVVYYNGDGTLAISIAADEKSVDIEDTHLFPGWELKLVMEIHNAGTAPLWLWSEIMHNGVPILETDLLTLFRIDYTDGLYNDPGPDEEWFTGDDDPFELSLQLFPNDHVYKLEHLIFDAQGFPELQGQSFTFQVIIHGSATTPGGP